MSSKDATLTHICLVRPPRGRPTAAGSEKRGGEVRWLKVEEARQIANCSQQTIYKLCESGELPACNLGSRKRRDWRIEEDELIKWMREGGVR